MIHGAAKAHNQSAGMIHGAAASNGDEKKTPVSNTHISQRLVCKYIHQHQMS
jgi:hypothetical protein